MDNSSPGLFEPNSGWPNTYLLIRGLFAVANAAIFTLDAALWRGNRYDSLLSQLGELLRRSRRILNRKGGSSNRSMEADNALVGKIRYKLREQGRQVGRQVGREEQARLGRTAPGMSACRPRLRAAKISTSRLLGRSGNHIYFFLRHLSQETPK